MRRPDFNARWVNIRGRWYERDWPTIVDIEEAKAVRRSMRRGAVFMVVIYVAAVTALYFVTKAL